MPSLWTIGYERLTPDALVAELRAAGVRRLLDVRYRPQSRRPGMSKTRLAARLAQDGIDYEHRKTLGTRPTSGRCSEAGRRSERERRSAPASSRRPARSSTRSRRS